MGIQDVVVEIKRELPAFNDFLIRELRENEFETLIDFIAERLQECCEVIDPGLKLVNYNVLSPSERLQFEINSPHQKNRMNIRVDEAVLVAYNFRYSTVEFTKHLYVPAYMYEDSSIVVGGTRYECQLTMVEKLFSINARSNGVTIKVIRSPIRFYRNTLHSFKDLATEKQFLGNLVSCSIYWKTPPKTARRLKPTVIHYLLCKFTLEEVLLKLELPPDSASFVVTDEYDEGWYYFKAQDRALNKGPVILKVNKDLMDTNRNMQDLATAISYLMVGTRNPITLKLATTESQMLFRILLGKIIYGPNTDMHQSLNFMNKHLQSVDTYLDSYTRDLFKSSGIFVDTIYDLLVFVATNMFQIITNHPNNDMFNKRLETIRAVVIEGMFKFLYLQIYKQEKKKEKKFMEEVVADILRISPRFILASLGKSESTRFNPSVQTDNWLLTVSSKAVKKLSAIRSAGTKKNSGGLINSPVNRFHPSMVICESVIGFSNTNPGSSFVINPYSTVDSTGGFVKSDRDIEMMKQLGKLFQG